MDGQANTQEVKQTPSFTNLVEVLQTSVAREGSRPLFGVPGDQGFDWISYSEFGSMVDRVRAGFAKLGVQRGDRIAVISNNRLEWAVGAHACYSLGAAYVAMYESQHDKDWRYILEDSGAVLCMVAGSGIEDRVNAMRSSLPALRHVVNLDADESVESSYRALLKQGEADPVAAHVPAPDEIATLIYTSGTTGNPKGVILTHKNLAANVNSMLEIVDIGSGDRGLAFLPWAHVFGGCVELNLAIATGSSTGICADPTKLIEYLPQVQPTVLFAVPRVWNKIHAGVTSKMAAAPAPIRWAFETALSAKKRHRRGEPIGLSERLAIGLADKVIFPKVHQGLGGKLRFAVSGAAALSLEVAEFMLSIGVEVHEGYGLSETGGGATAQPRDAVRLGTVGVALPGVRLELDMSVPSAGEDEGELIIYGQNVMVGYHNLPEESKKSLTSDGGLRTGDLARIDGDGYVSITGRVKELYKLENGRYVAPVPLEEQLERSQYIAQAIVTGQNKPHNVALIIPDMAVLRPWCDRNGVTGDDDGLLSSSKVLSLLEAEVERCNVNFKGYERIMDFVVDSEELTPQNGMLTPTLKPKRRAIAAKYQSDWESLYPQATSERPAPRASYIRELRGVAKTG